MLRFKEVAKLRNFLGVCSDFVKLQKFRGVCSDYIAKLQNFRGVFSFCKVVLSMGTDSRFNIRDLKLD